MSQSLYSIKKDMIALESLILEQDGEITDLIIENWMIINEKNLAEKVDHYKYFLESLEQGAQFFKDKAEEATKARKHYENVIDRLNNNLKQTMNDLGTDELIGNEYRYKLVRGKPKVEVLDEEKLPAKYMREIVELKPDKDLIKKELESSVEIEGARLVESYSVKSYLVKKGLK